MASFTTLVCDRCGAQFPLEERGFTGERPVQKAKWEFPMGYKEEKDLCTPCREQLKYTIKEFMMKGKK